MNGKVNRGYFSGLNAVMPGRKARAAQQVAEQEKAKARPSVPKSREGKQGLLTYVDPAVIKQLKLLAAEHDTSQKALIEEALNDLFKKYGNPPIA